MKKLLFATSNANKLREVREILANQYEVLSLKDIDWNEEIPEPFDTIRENSIYKANYFFEKMGMDCISEDSGLEVEALDGRPSAYSARYAGESRDDIQNYQKVLAEMQGESNRTARFKSIITYKTDTICETFEGEMLGAIGFEPKGSNGFGYDPIFIPEGKNQTNAELTSEEKNAISHRKKALAKLVDFFKTLG
jgi:XTP/dITP diphosphohydrolase